jgi:hypothetical protein
MPRLTIAELEADIGFVANNGGFTVQSDLEYRLGAETKTKARAIEWLTRQGIPDKSARTALNSSIASAYCNKSYLQSWRRRINPSWDLLDGTGDDVDSAPYSVPPAPAPRTEAPQASPLATEKWLRELFAQIEKTVEKLVKTRLDNTTIKLDPGAQAQIKQIALTTAQETVREMMPPRQIEVRHVETNLTVPVGLQHERFPTLLRAINARDHKGFRLNPWLTGPTGSGKTSACEAVARALALPFGSDGSLDADYKVLGFRDANGNIISTQFLNIYEHGGIYVADEIDNWAPSALLSLNAALANGWISCPSGIIQRHKDACIIACANTWGLGATSDYVGRTRLDAASLDRFQPKIDWPYDQRFERAIAAQQSPRFAEMWHTHLVKVRSRVATQGLKIIISPRATFNGLALLEAGFAPHEVVDMTIAAGLSPEQKRTINVYGDLPTTTQAPTPTPIPPAPTASQRRDEMVRITPEVTARSNLTPEQIMRALGLTPGRQTDEIPF